MSAPNQALRPDLAVIAAQIAPNTRVLDVGCGDGALLASLRDAKGVDARGMEIDAALVAECVARGLSVVQGDAERDLVDYPDGAFDYAVLGQTLQTAQRPDLLLTESCCASAAPHSSAFPISRTGARVQRCCGAGGCR